MENSSLLRRSKANLIRHRHHHMKSHHMEDDSGTESAISNDRNNVRLENHLPSVDPLEIDTTVSYHDDIHYGGNDEEGEREDEELLYPVKVIGPEDDKTWRDKLDDFLFPPDLPRSCQLLRPENIAIPACYLLVGLLQGLSSPLINVFPVDLKASEAQQTTISTIRSLPASFKLLFGFISDTSPIFGYRRKPYMLLGWLLASASIMVLMTFSNVNVPSRNAGFFHAHVNENTQPPEDAPSIPFLALCLLGFGVGFWIADVMGDSIVAEKAKLEPPEKRGSVQSSCYSYRFFGLMIAAPFSTYLHAAYGPHVVFTLLAIMPLSILPLVYILEEQKDTPIAPVRDQCHEIWKTVCSRAVWQPMGFVYLYNVMQIGNGAWREFETEVLKFTSFQLNLLLVIGHVLLYFGILAYKYVMIHWSWRKVYVYTTSLNAFFSVLQVLLIYGITFGLSPFLFALGDDVFVEFLSGVQFLPTTIMMVHLCPVGSEGASYAMFTTVNNSALALSSMLATNLLCIWDVSTAAFERGEVQGMANLTYLTTAIQTAALLFVGLLPRYKEDLEALKGDHDRSKVGGSIFLAIVGLSLTYSLYVAYRNIMEPDWRNSDTCNA